MKAITSWMIDGIINLSVAAEAANWNRQATVDSLCASGLNAVEAGHFADFLFCENAKIKDPGERPEDYLTEAEWERLT